MNDANLSFRILLVKICATPLVSRICSPSASSCGPASSMAVMSCTADIEATARFS